MSQTFSMFDYEIYGVTARASDPRAGGAHERSQDTHALRLLQHAAGLSFEEANEIYKDVQAGQPRPIHSTWADLPEVMRGAGLFVRSVFDVKETLGSPTPSPSGPDHDVIMTFLKALPGNMTVNDILLVDHAIKMAYFAHAWMPLTPTKKGT